jgi:hypothetical protein
MILTVFLFYFPQKKKEADIISMYFKEKMKLNGISTTCQETESNIKAVLFRVRQKVLRIFSEFEHKKDGNCKSLVKEFTDHDDLKALKKDGLSEEGIIFIIENAFEVEMSQSRV